MYTIHKYDILLLTDRPHHQILSILVMLVHSKLGFWVKITNTIIPQNTYQFEIYFRLKTQV